jgi:hypothetical protein
VRAGTPTCDFDHMQNSESASRINLKLMCGRTRLVALTLAITMLALPVAALSSCRLLSAGTSDSHPCCPTVRGGAPITSLHQAPMEEPCCQVSSSKPEQQSGLATPTNNALEVIPAATSSSVEVPSVVFRTHLVELLFRPPSAFPQAVLCTFLI